MFERLLELFLHAKTGAIAAVFLIGTTGALVTATVQNGVTTITITEVSPSPSASASASPTASPTASPSASTSSSPSASPSSSPSSSAAANACSAQAHAAADAVKTVNSAFSRFHTDLEHARKTDAGRATVENADRLLEQIRDNAVKAIHATSTCAKTDEDDKDKENEDQQDEDKNDDSGKHSQTNFVLAFFQKLFGKDATVTIVTTSPSPTASPTPTVAPSATPTSSPASGVTFSGSDPKAIADQAVAAMTLVVNDAKAKLAALPSASPKSEGKDRPFSPRPSKRPEPSQKHERD